MTEQELSELLEKEKKAYIQFYSILSAFVPRVSCLTEPAMLKYHEQACRDFIARFGDDISQEGSPFILGKD